MERRKFSQEEIEVLKKNPYTYKVTATQIRFTAEFKKFFWAQYQNGILPREILIMCGYDPDILGSTRIGGILTHIKETVEAGEEFHAENRRRSLISSQKNKPTDSTDEIKQLRSEVKYLRKEVEFLKKISSVKTFGKQVKS